MLRTVLMSLDAGDSGSRRETMGRVRQRRGQSPSKDAYHHGHYCQQRSSVPPVLKKCTEYTSNYPSADRLDPCPLAAILYWPSIAHRVSLLS